jgi:hypothetical protein
MINETKEDEPISPKTAEVLKKYQVDQNTIIGFDKVECRPILASELICVENPPYNDLTLIPPKTMTITTKYLYRRGEQ